MRKRLPETKRRLATKFPNWASSAKIDLKERTFLKR